MKTACVTGATGCVGRNLIDELMKGSWDIVVLHRKSSDLSFLKGCNVRFQEVDLYDPVSVARAIPEKVDAIFHVAGNTSHWAAEAGVQWKDNVLATRNIVQAALERKGCRMIFTTTGATLGNQGWDEARASRIVNGYVRTKRLAEIEVYRGIEKGLDAVLLHPIIVMGAYDRSSYAKIFQSMKHGWLRCCFPGRIAFCHAADVAEAHVRAYERGRRGERYVLGGIHATWLEAFREICARVGVGGPVVIPKSVLMVASHFMAWGAWLTGKKPLLTPDLVGLLRDAPDVEDSDKRKARQDLGYSSRPLEVMVEDCYQWLLKENLI